MGYDGDKGMLEIKEAGADTIAQDEASCVVFGMPKVAIGLGAIATVMPLENIAGLSHGNTAKPTHKSFKN